MAFCIQYPCSMVSRMLSKRKWICKILIVLLDDLVKIVACLGNIALWRGIWVLCDLYIWPENKEWSSWTTHGLGMAVLMLTLTSSGCALRGCALDGEPVSGRHCHLAVGYISDVARALRFTKERKQVLVSRRCEGTAMSRHSSERY